MTQKLYKNNLLVFLLISLLMISSVSAFRLADYITGNAVIQDDAGCKIEKLFVGINDKATKSILDNYNFKLVSVSKDRKKAKIRVNNQEVTLEQGVAINHLGGTLGVEGASEPSGGIDVVYSRFANKRLEFEVKNCEEEAACLTEVVRLRFGQVKQFTFANKVYDVKVNYIGNAHKVSVIVNNGKVQKLNGKNSNLNIEGLLITNKNTRYGENHRNRWADLEVKYCAEDALDQPVCAEDSDVIDIRDKTVRSILNKKINLFNVAYLGRYITVTVDGNPVRIKKGTTEKFKDLEIYYSAYQNRQVNLKFKDCIPETVEEELEDEPIGLIEQLENGIRATLGLDGFGAEFEGREVFLYNVGENAVAVRVIGSGGLEYIESIILDQSKLIDGIDIFVEEIFFDERRAILAITNRVDEGPITVPNPEDEDLNADGTITEADVELWQSLFRSCIFGDNQACTTADINADTSIDGRDKRKIRDAIE